MTLSVRYTSELETRETITADVPAATDAVLVHGAFDTELRNLGGASTPPVDACAYFSKALAAGVGSIDLTALPHRGITVDGSGKRVQFLKLKNPATNANSITIAKGASNGYAGLGAASSLTLVPGAEVLLRTLDGGADISGTNKTLDLTGTGVQTLDVAVVLG